MRGHILVTGSEGLIGGALRRALERAGHVVRGLDLRATGADAGDTRDRDRVRRALSDCRGVVHLAAVSRVMWAEADPARCHATNVTALETLIELATSRPDQPWLVFGSSREVYGHPARLPADEDSPLHPMNRYAESKVSGERCVARAVAAGLRATTVRFSNVYGSPDDHADRVVPAFARAAARGAPLVVRGPDQSLDFTHVDDVTVALRRLIERLEGAGEPPPTLHLVSGRAATLGGLARSCVELAQSSSTVEHRAPTGVHVPHFVGCGARAQKELGWTPAVSLERGLSRLIDAYRVGASVTVESEL